MKFYQSIFLIIIALITAISVTVVNADKAQSSATKKRKNPSIHSVRSTQGERKRKIKFDDIKSKKHMEIGHSDGLQSYPGKTTYPVNTQALPTTWTSHMGNDW